MSDLPEPLVPPECDLRDFPDMMLDVRRLLQSETWIGAAEVPKIGHAAMCLWCECWHQMPAASLPDNDTVLARLAMCTAKQWEKLKPSILHGWLKCSDGRLYHPVVAEKAMLAWSKRITLSRRGKAGAAAKWSKGDGASMAQASSTQASGNAIAMRADGKGEEKGEEKGEREEKGKTAVGGSGYVFSGKIIRLNAANFAEWQTAYFEIPDLRAELTSLDAYYDHELQGKERGNWFIRCSTALSKRHQEWAAKKAEKFVAPPVGRAWA